MSDIASTSSPAQPQAAASLLLLRDRDGVEVLVGRRSPATRAFPGATVFPGGKLEPQDADWPDAGDALRTAAYAALRETFEETGVFVCAGGEGPPQDVDVARARLAVEAGETVFADLSARWARPLDLQRLTPFAHWITPTGAPYRFDTCFFLVEASTYEAEATLICAEFEQLGWARPAELLRDERRRLMTPTRHCLKVLQGASTAAEAIAAALRRGPYDGERERAAG